MKNIALSFAVVGVGLWIAMFDGCSSGSNGGSLDGGSATTTTSGTGGGDLCSRACAKLDAVHCAGDTPGQCAMALCR